MPNRCVTFYVVVKYEKCNELHRAVGILSMANVSSTYKCDPCAGFTRPGPILAHSTVLSQANYGYIESIFIMVLTSHPE